jgi:hypothetical protein
MKKAGFLADGRMGAVSTITQMRLCGARSSVTLERLAGGVVPGRR